MINKNGDIYKSKIIDELTQTEPSKDEFSKVGTISNEDLIAIEDIIHEMKKEELKSSKHSEDYGLSVNIGENLLYGCEYFLQEKVNKLNSIMQIDIDKFIDIRPEDIKSIKIKNEDFIYKVITITLNDKTKYVMKTAKKIKGADYHKDNLKKFIEIYNK